MKKYNLRPKPLITIFALAMILFALLFRSDTGAQTNNPPFQISRNRGACTVSLAGAIACAPKTGRDFTIDTSDGGDFLVNGLPVITSLTNLSASALASGTVPDARFPATLPAASGINLTALNANNLASGTVPDARFPATLPAGIGLTNPVISPQGSAPTASGGFVLWADTVHRVGFQGVGISGNRNAKFSFNLTADRNYNFPDTDMTVARIDAGQTFTGNQIFSDSIAIGGGTAILKHLSAAAALNFANQVAIGCNDLTITVTGAALSDTITLGIPNGAVVNGTATFTAWVSSANTVTVRYCNLVSGDPASATFRVDVWQH